ncbi:MAG: YdcF family protein [Planctomycetota bacterium]
MVRGLTVALRPFGVALGVFIALNLALALQRPELAVTGVWLDASLPEPWLSLFAGILGFCLLLPGDVGSSPRVRWIAGGVFAGFALLALGKAAAFYVDWARGLALTDFPFPLSALVGPVLASEFVRIVWWSPRRPRVPPPARVFLGGLAAAAAFLAINLVHILEFGHRDFREPADAAVVFGARVLADGRPSAVLRERIETAVELHREGYVPRLLMTGGVDAAGMSEPVAMRRYAIELGVPPESIIIDEEGANTMASAARCRELAREYGFEEVLAVTQYFHCARVKMVFEREGVRCRTVPARTLGSGGRRLARELFFVFRELIAFPFYLIYYR